MVKIFVLKKNLQGKKLQHFLVKIGKIPPIKARHVILVMNFFILILDKHDYKLWYRVSNKYK